MADETSPTQPENTPPEQPASGWQTLVTTIKEWPTSRKAALAGVALLSLILFAFIILQARTADYQLLYGNLTTDDAASVTEWLQGNNIPYKLTGNGSSIQIPSEQVLETRLQLASAGLPQGGGVGFEIFDKQSFALTDFVQKVNYGRALQGELARTIANLGPVESARVHLVLPERRLFKEQQKPATASVILKLTPGRRLSATQVDGIVHLVSGSIEGLEPDKVTIIDQNGNVLTMQPKKGLIPGLSTTMLEHQLQIESNLESRAQALLNRALGDNKAMVRVTADLDFAQTEKTEELFDPEEPVVRSEQLQEERSGTEIVGGVPGVQSNLQGNTNPTASATPPSSRTQRTTNYEISKIISKTINPVGTIKKLSVSVLVPDKVEPAEGDQEPKTVPRTEQELDALRTMISSALGLDKVRGDKIEVISMPLTDPTEYAAGTEREASKLYQYMPYIRYGLIALAGLMIYFLLVRPMVKTVQQDVTEHYKTVEELEREASGEGEDTEPPPDPIIAIRESVAENPVFAAHIIKGWISSDAS